MGSTQVCPIRAPLRLSTNLRASVSNSGWRVRLYFPSGFFDPKHVRSAINLNSGCNSFFSGRIRHAVGRTALYARKKKREDNPCAGYPLEDRHFVEVSLMVEMPSFRPSIRLTQYASFR